MNAKPTRNFSDAKLPDFLQLFEYNYQNLETILSAE